MRNFKLGIHRDARPQATFLLTAAALSILLWFIPFAEVLTYPFRLFVTFIHEGGHALAALLTGNTVESLSIATNASGETYTTQGGLFSAIPFTFLAGTLLTLGLVAVAKFANSRLATFFLSFLAVQCVLNALLDLKTVFFLSTPFAPGMPSDAVNMANATGIPALVWASVWIAVSVGILLLTMRLYVSGRKKQFSLDQAFEPVPLFPTTIGEKQLR